MKTFLTFNEFQSLNEDKDEDDNVKARIEKLAKDEEVHKKLGVSDVSKLKHAFMALYKRGYGAAQTNWGAVRPEIKKLGRPAAWIAWGYGRMNAFIRKSKGYHTSDKDIADWLDGKGEKPEPK